MRKSVEFQFDSRDGKTSLRAEKFLPPKEVRAVLIVVHGMNEYFGRYREMSEFLASQGIHVAGHDQLGHGHTPERKEDFGYFCERDAATVLVRDVHRLKKIIQEENPGVPVFLLGHSMGSFIARNYIEMYGTGIRGVILMGSGDISRVKTWLGRHFTRFLAFFQGWRHRSRFCTMVSIGSYENSVPPEERPLGWTAKREEAREEFRRDPLRGHEFTLNGYHALAELFYRASDSERMKKIPRELPVFLISGSEDPIGENGAGVRRIAEGYRAVGMKDVSVKIFEGDRHEVHHEADRYDAFLDILHFIERNIETQGAQQGG